MTTTPEWRKSSRSGVTENTDCVEVARLPDAVGVRDSKNTNGPYLSLGRADFARLAQELKSGRHQC